MLGRQVILDADAGDYSSAMDSLAKTSAVWARLKPAILARNGSDAAAKIESSLEKQQAALEKEDVSALKEEANIALELVDVMENLF
jgi:hypothetical protein